MTEVTTKEKIKTGAKDAALGAIKEEAIGIGEMLQPVTNVPSH